MNNYPTLAAARIAYGAEAFDKVIADAVFAAAAAMKPKDVITALCGPSTRGAK